MTPEEVESQVVLVGEIDSPYLGGWLQLYIYIYWKSSNLTCAIFFQMGGSTTTKSWMDFGFYLDRCWFCWCKKHDMDTGYDKYYVKIYIDIDSLMLMYNMYILSHTYVWIMRLSTLFSVSLLQVTTTLTVYPKARLFPVNSILSEGQGFPHMKSVEISNICPNLLDHSKIGTITLSFSVFGWLDHFQFT